VARVFVLLVSWLICSVPWACVTAANTKSRGTVIDSVRAVQKATAALREARRDEPGRTYRVLEFTRDRDGVLVYLSPVYPEGVIGGGGGGRIRIGHNGKATVLELGI
jgi:hypothetical protein